MSSESALTWNLRLTLPALALLLFCACASLPAHAQPAPSLQHETATVTLDITVRDKETGKPVANAQIHIARSGAVKSGMPLRDIIAATDENGKLIRKDTYFDLTGEPHALRVTAPGYPLEFQKDLTDEMLRDAMRSGPLNIYVPLAKSPPSVLPGQTSHESPEHPGSWLAAIATYAGWVLMLLLLGLFLIVIPFIAIRYGSVRVRLPWTFNREERAPSLSGPGNDRSLIYLKEIANTLRSLKQQQADALKREEALLAQVIKNNEILAKGITVISIHEESAGAKLPEPFSYSPKETFPGMKKKTTAQHKTSLSSTERAIRSYRDMLSSGPRSSEPIYLNVDEQSLKSMLEDNNVYLSQVGHTQGAFVLFTYGKDSGWVFPNPTIKFRPDALKLVFPTLTEKQFEDSMEKIVPKRVRRVEERRWKVEAGF